MHYAIFIPNVNGATDNHFKNVGLDALAGTGAAWSEVVGDKYGMMATWPATEPEQQTPVKYDAIPQWHDYEQFFVGIDPERPVRPVDIARQQFVSSREVELKDGHVWRIPIAFHLPTAMKFDGKEWFEGYPSQYADFAAAAGEVSCALYQQVEELGLLDADISPDATLSMQLKNAVPYACLALSVNYRITEEIADCLDLFDAQSLASLVGASVDIPDIIAAEREKKNEAGAGTQHGLTT